MWRHPGISNSRKSPGPPGSVVAVKSSGEPSRTLRGRNKNPEALADSRERKTLQVSPPSDCLLMLFTGQFSNKKRGKKREWPRQGSDQSLCAEQGKRGGKQMKWNGKYKRREPTNSFPTILTRTEGGLIWIAMPFILSLSLAICV